MREQLPKDLRELLDRFTVAAQKKYPNAKIQVAAKSRNMMGHSIYTLDILATASTNEKDLQGQFFVEYNVTLDEAEWWVVYGGS